MKITNKLNKLIMYLWGVVIVTVQVTSFKFFPSFMTQLSMKPLALYPLFLLLILLIIWKFNNKKINIFPFNIKILILLGIVIAFSGLFGYIEWTQKGIAYSGYWNRFLKATISLITGILFFLSSYIICKFIILKRNNSIFLHISFAIALFWGFIQAIAIYTPLIDPQILENFQRIFMAGAVRTNRVYGFAFEPSWYSDQLLILYLPWIVGGIIVFNKQENKNKWVEIGGFGSIIFLLFLTYSRSGLLNVIIALFIVFFIFGKEQLLSLWKFFVIKPIDEKQQKIRVLSVVLAIITLLFFIYVFVNQDYFVNIFIRGFKNGFAEYIVKNSAGPRLAYTVSAFRVFENYPWTGVGFGISGLYMIEFLPEWSYNLPEIGKAILPATFQIMNPKNMYVRLLAETGLVGFWIFISFLLSILSKIIQMLNNKLQDAQFIGIVGLFAWIVIVLRFFSIDSLTFPVMWMTLGMFLGFAARIEETGSLDEIG